MTADVSLGTLFGGTPAITMEVVGLQTFVEQKADGTSNLQRLARQSDRAGGDAPTTPPRGDRPDDDDERDEQRPDLSGLAIDVAIRDCLVEVRREGQLIERMSDLGFRVFSAAGSPELEVDGNATLLAGSITLDVDADTRTGDADAKLDSHGLDLARWHPIVEALMPGQLTALAGKVDGELLATVRNEKRIELGGELIVDAPHLAGPLLQDMDVRSPQWRIAPTLALGTDANSDVDTSRFAIDLGWLQVRGKPADAPGIAALGYDLDIAKLAEFGGPMPKMLKGTGSRLTGELRLPTKDLPKDADGWTKAIVLAADLQMPKLDVAGFELRDLGAAANVTDGAFVLTTSDATKLDGGPLVANVKVDLTDLGTLATTASVQWQGGQLDGASTKLLRYAVPLFAGLDGDVAKVVGKCNLTLNLTGPASKPEDATWLTWLDNWSGSGSLGLFDAAFAPSSELQGLIAPLGPLLAKQTSSIATDGKLNIDSFTAPFEFAKGYVKSTATEWLAKGQKIGLSGSAALDGSLDYALDLSALLQGHRDGEKVLQAVGGKLPATKLGGTLDAPSLALPELGNLAQKLLEEQGKDLLKKGLEDLFK